VARRLLAEVVGAYALVAVAAGADVVARAHGHTMSPAARAVAPGIVVMALIHALSDVSGAHFNPAVTVSFALRRDLPGILVAPYVAAQLIGAASAAATWRWLEPASISAAVTTIHVSTSHAVATEALLTFFLVLVIVNTAVRPSVVGPQAAIAVGGTIALCGIVGGPLSGPSMNPARSLGAALVASDWANQWVYVVGPLLGAVAAVLLTWVLRPHHVPGEREAAQGEPEPAGAGTRHERARAYSSAARTP
jgi:aquaporin Z